MFPESFTFSIANLVNDWVDALVTNYGDVFRQISDTLLWAIVNLEGLLRMAPWWLMLAIVGGIAWHATRKIVTTAVTRCGAIVANAIANCPPSDQPT